jgi:2-polyprenyl-6-methoxyphenol hydroxylase-like FAD-dependent oxidoreductase
MRFEESVEKISNGQLGNVPDYIYWVLGGRQSVINVSDEELVHMSSQQIVDLSLELTRDWDEGIRSLFLLQSQDQSSTIRLLSSSPNIASWKSIPTITLMGDAIHPMPPTGGSGANTALRDAVYLYEMIQKGVTKDTIEQYESKMREYGSEMIAMSWQGGKHLLNIPSYEDCQPIEP